MKILIEAQPLLRQRTGVGQYAYHLIEHLVPLLAQRHDQLSLFYFNFLKKRKSIPVWGGNVSNRECTLLPGRAIYYLWKKMAFPPMECVAGSADLIHFPNFIVRPFKKGKAVVTVHDLSFVRYPQFAESKNLAYLNRWIPDSLERASRILVVSEFTKKELIDIYGIEENKIVVAYNGVRSDYKPTQDEDRLHQLRQKYKLPKAFALAVGTLEPRKNYTLLIKAYEYLKKAHRSLPPLIFVGPPGWNKEYDRLKEMVVSKQLQDSIHFLFYVDEEDMIPFYSAARVLLFPSVYEGFGLPVLEAMACGTPVICSNAASLPEVSGNAALTLRPDNPEEWGDTLISFWNDEAKQQEMRELGLVQSKKFTWEETAKKTLEAYEQALRN